MNENADRLEDCRWFPFSDDPLVSGSVFHGWFSNPQILLPEQSCDSRWHMFCHSWKGLLHYVSTSGIAWERGCLIQKFCSCPSIFRDKENYCLIYETHYSGFGSHFRASGTSPSRIEMRLSTDLVTWSKPRIIFDGESLSSSSDYLPAPRLLNPQIINTGSEYRLFFGSSLVSIPGMNRSVARYLSCASCSELQGMYSVNDGNGMLMQPDPDSPYTNLACGSVRIVKTDCGYYSFQCPLYWDAVARMYRTCLILSKSNDAITWKSVREKPVLVPAGNGWASGFITGCDVQFRKQENNWYCYYFAFNQNGTIESKDSLGLLLGCVPQQCDKI